MQEIHLRIPVRGVSTEVLCASDAKEEQSGHVEASGCAQTGCGTAIVSKNNQ